jgi:PAS domain S-box-containing protein
MNDDYEYGHVTGNGTRTELALRASELSYRRLFEAAKDGILILDAGTGRITDVNPFLFKLLGYSRSEMVGKTVGELSPFNDIWSNEVMLERLQKDGYVRYHDQPLQTKNGHKIAVEFVSNVYQAGDKKVIQCNIRDMTGRKLAEKTLTRLAAIVESSEDAIIGKDLDGIIQSWNAGAEKIFGYSAGEMIGNSIMRLIPVERMEEESHVLLAIKHGESMRNFETVWLAKNSRRIDVSVTVSPIKDSAGKIVGASKVARDITERKQAEAESRKSQLMLEEIINAIPVRVFWKDRNLTYLGCNAVFARDAGFGDQKDIIGKDDFQMGWRDQAEKYRADDSQVIEGGCPKLLIEEPQTTPEGKTITLLSSKIPLRDSDGKTIGLLGTYMDITERKKAEAATNRLAAIVEFSADAIVGNDLDGTITSWNTGAEKIFGYSAGQMVGGPMTRLIPADRPDEENQILEQVKRGESVQHFETVRQAKGGRRIDVSVTISPIKDSAGKIVGASKVARDITERKRAEEELCRKTAFLEALVDSALDGILVVDNQGKQILENKRMNDLWKFPAHIAGNKSDSDQIQFAANQTKNPKEFVEKTDHLYSHPDEISRDEIALIDGTVLDRYSSPVRDKAGKHYGRIWTFRDITDRRKT